MAEQSQDEEARQKPQPGPDGYPRAEQLRRLAIAVVVAAVVVAGVYWLREETSGPRAAEPATLAEVESACEAWAWVRDELVAPADAEFGESTITGDNGEASLTGPWTVVGTVDAPNRLGVTIRMQYTCDVRQAGSELVGSADVVE